MRFDEIASTPVEAWGYAYNRRDQREQWRRTFPSETAARAWADYHNATIVEIRPKLQEEQLDELSFLGSPCTKDCSGHRAGYAWSQSKGGQVANSPFSPSFNKGSQLHVDGK